MGHESLAQALERFPHLPRIPGTPRFLLLSPPDAVASEMGCHQGGWAASPLVTLLPPVPLRSPLSCCPPAVTHIGQRDTIAKVRCSTSTEARGTGPSGTPPPRWCQTA